MGTISVPTKASLTSSLTEGLKGGVVGGGVTTLIFALTRSPELSQLAGGIIGGAMLGGDTGKIVTVNGCMDAITTFGIRLFGGGSA